MFRYPVTPYDSCTFILSLLVHHLPEKIPNENEFAIAKLYVKLWEHVQQNDALHSETWITRAMWPPRSSVFYPG